MAQIQIAEGDQQKLKRSAWIAIATEDSALVDPPTQMGVNAATGKPMAMRLPPDERGVEVDGKVVAVFSWASHTYPGPDWEDDLGIVNISFDPEHSDYVCDLAQRYASQMGAELVFD